MAKTAILVALVTLALAALGLYSAGEAQKTATSAQATLSAYIEAPPPQAGIESRGYTGFFGISIDHNGDDPAIKIRQRGAGVAIQIQNASATPIAQMNNAGQWSVPFQNPLITGTPTPTRTPTPTNTSTSTPTPTLTPTSTPTPTNTP